MEGQELNGTPPAPKPCIEIYYDKETQGVALKTDMDVLKNHSFTKAILQIAIDFCDFNVKTGYAQAMAMQAQQQVAQQVHLQNQAQQIRRHLK